MSVLKGAQYAAVATPRFPVPDDEDLKWCITGHLLTNISQYSTIRVAPRLTQDSASIQIEFTFKGTEEYTLEIDLKECDALECMQSEYFFEKGAEKEKLDFWRQLDVDFPAKGNEQRALGRSRGYASRYSFLILSLTKVKASKIIRPQTGLENQGDEAKEFVRMMGGRDRDLEVIIFWDADTSVPQLKRFVDKCEYVKRTLQETPEMLQAGKEQKQESKKLKEVEKAKDKPQSPIRKPERATKERPKGMKKQVEEEKARREKELQKQLDIKNERDSKAEIMVKTWEGVVAAGDELDIKADDDEKTDKFLEMAAKQLEAMRLTQAARKALNQ